LSKIYKQKNMERQQCTRCRVNLTLDKFNKKRDDTYMKRCIDCNTYSKKYQRENKCEHNKQKPHCKLGCGGISICEHKRIRYQCKDCCGASICEHNKVKSSCKDCGGSVICEHNRQRPICRDCGGSQICQHGRQRPTCKYCNFAGYISNVVRSQVRNALKKYNQQKINNPEFLGCDIDDFKQHIEQQFKEGMNWDNYGQWHIDHITPIKYGNPTIEEVYTRLHYTNTQPMWAADNIAKSNRYIG
jgi:hypothetical protein